MFSVAITISDTIPNKMSESSTTKKQSKFDKIIEEINNDGPFQMRFFLFISLVTFMVSLQYTSKIISMVVPDHWCHVPGRENTNYTIDEWKNITIPIESTNGINKFSKCKRFSNEDKNKIVKCDQGWEYDHTWYDMTASLQNNWVCDDQMIPTHVLAINRASDMIGTFVLGQLADNYGRKPMFFIALTFILIGRTAVLFTSSSVLLFLTFSFIGSMSNSTLFLSAYIIALEISGANKRAYVTLIKSYGFACGLTISPLIMWWQRDWIKYGLIITVPCSLILFSIKWMIESPRWLASTGKIQRCNKVLNKIAKVNKTQLPETLAEQLLKDDINSDKKIYTILSLFSSARLAKNVLILVYSISAMTILFLCFMISASEMAGNPYLNYTLLGIVDVPVYITSKYGCDRFGRRFVVSASLLFAFLGCLFMAFIVQDPSKTILIAIVCIITKGFVAMSLNSLYLLVTEICPTCVRQTGTSLCSIFSSSLSISGPYIVSLGMSVNVTIPYFIYASLAFVAFVASAFVPETKGQQLPDTLEDAACFGVDQNIWGRSKKATYQGVSLAANSDKL